LAKSKVVIDNLVLKPNEDETLLEEILYRQYKTKEFVILKILKKSLDARKKNNIIFRYRLLIEIPKETLSFFLNKNKNNYEYSEDDLVAYNKKIQNNKEVFIIGSGPSGLFAALRLAEAGFQVKIFERGKKIEDRNIDVALLKKQGKLNLESNIVFGEGGAGTYSDGKLTSRSKKKEVFWIYENLIKFGADKSIAYETKPHLGTDNLKRIIKNLRDELKNLGVEIFFESKLTDIELIDGELNGFFINDKIFYETNLLILAIGHSARDTYSFLKKKNIFLEKKGFAVGFRVEHSSDLINNIQYGNSKYKNILPRADYFLKYNNPQTKRGVYSFCMCPGGEVINSSSEEGRLCVNGMSNSSRDGRFSNSAIVVTVNVNDLQGDSLAGLSLQRDIETKAFNAGGGDFFAPAQNIESFIFNKNNSFLGETSYLPGVKATDFREILPMFIYEELKQGIQNFNRKMNEFIRKDATLIGVETRTSSPVRITRKKNFESINTKGLFPIGEGAGYSGGIISSAVDGVRAANALIEKFSE